MAVFLLHPSTVFICPDEVRAWSWDSNVHTCLASSTGGPNQETSSMIFAAQLEVYYRTIAPLFACLGFGLPDFKQNLSLKGLALF